MRTRPLAQSKRAPRTRKPAPAPRRPAGRTTGVGEPGGRAPLDLETLSGEWRAAFDAAESALRDSARLLPSQELRVRGSRLAAERQSVVQLLDGVARDRGSRTRFSHLLVSRLNLRRLLGLPPGVDACVFNLDGVLIGSAAVHAEAWTETFDEFIATRTARTHGRWAPFNPRTDYPQHIHGRPRLEGVREFLASRGISLPEGDPEDPPGTETVHGLANRKKEALLRRIEEHGIPAFEGSRRYLEIARDAELHRAVVSASANTHTILEQAGLAGLIEGCVDGNTMVDEHLRGRPEPDVLLAACARIGVDPGRAAVFETSAAGLTAARAAGFQLVVGVERTERAGALLAHGADLVIPGLAELLERQAQKEGIRTRA